MSAATWIDTTQFGLDRHVWDAKPEWAVGAAKVTFPHTPYDDILALTSLARPVGLLSFSSYVQPSARNSPSCCSIAA